MEFEISKRNHKKLIRMITRRFKPGQDSGEEDIITGMYDLCRDIHGAGMDKNCWLWTVEKMQDFFGATEEEWLALMGKLAIYSMFRDGLLKTGPHGGN